MPEQQRQCNTVTPTHEGTYVATDCCKRCSAVHGGVKFTTTKLMENRQTCTYVNNLWKSRWMGEGADRYRHSMEEGRAYRFMPLHEDVRHGCIRWMCQPHCIVMFADSRLKWTDEIN